MTPPGDQRVLHPDLAAAVDVLQLAEEEMTNAQVRSSLASLPVETCFNKPKQELIQMHHGPHDPSNCTALSFWQVSDALYVQHHARYDELLSQWWLHHSRPPGRRQSAKADATHTLQQQNEQHVILDLWPWGCHTLQGPWEAAPPEVPVEGPPAVCESLSSRLQLSESSKMPPQMPQQLCFGGPPAPQLAEISVQLRQAKQLLQAAYTEPSWLRGGLGVFDTSWGPLLKATELLMSR
jgi:hypothetical protein